MKDKQYIHEGHRQRLKNRFLETGFDTFEPHNILELLLFYSIPRKDTNEIAHSLIDRFGSLKGVFDASYDELIQVDGIKESSATLIKMIPKLAQQYVSFEIDKDRIFDNAEKIGEYFINKFVGETNEVVYAMLLNNNFELLTVVKIHEGCVNSAHVSPRKIIDLVVKYNASMVVLAHNHPDGICCPSIEDIDTTSDLMCTFNNIDVTLIEHFLVARNEYFPIIHNTAGLRSTSKQNRDFFRRKSENI